LEKLTVGYFGGSITYGTGATDKDKTSWRALVTAFLKKRYDVYEINGGVGGTGSDLGAFRCQRDLLQYMPDIVFVEFAVNDYNNKEVLPYIEGIVRQILAVSIATKIIFVYTLSKAMVLNDYSKGQIPKSVMLQQKIADKYLIPCINVGQKLWEYCCENNIDLEEYLPDTVHPSDKGHFFYAQSIIETLQINAVSECAIENGTLLDACEYANDDWQYCNEEMLNCYPHYLSSDKIDAELQIDFYGNVIGVYWIIAKDSGDILWRIDDGAWQKTTCFDKFALDFERVHYKILASDLEDTNHTFKLKISSTKDELSTGHCIRIGAFLVNHKK